MCPSISFLYKYDYLKVGLENTSLKMIIKVHFCSFVAAEHTFPLGEMRLPANIF